VLLSDDPTESEVLNIEEESGDLESPAPHRIIRMTVAAGERSERVDQYLARMIGNTSRTKVHEAIDAGAILVNGTPLEKSSYKIKGGDEIEVHVPRPPRARAEAEDIPLDILFEDESILIINKPPGMVVHPAAGSRSGTLVNALLHHFSDIRTENTSGDPDRPGIVHRLDKDTSGLMVVARTEHAHRVLAKQFFNHTAQRTYQAIVWGNPSTQFGRIDTLQGRDPKDRKRFTVLAEGGKQAITDYCVLEEFTGFSLLEFKLKTGRTHQIRVHAQYLGHQIFGDAVYGGRAMNVVRHDVPRFKDWVENLLNFIPRQALHARSLRLNHPVTGELLEWTAPIPEDMSLVLHKLRSMRDKLYG
jgi:23S rRNA pseudouridine1911/1915/1917 synthase